MEVAVSSFLTALCVVIAYLVNSTVQEPYMDEIFHVPQAQHYCSGNFSYWDPMITTPPGQYFISLSWIYPLSFVLRIPVADLCTLTFLRAQNVMFTVFLFLVLCQLMRKIHGMNSTYSSVCALNLSLFPVLFFFSFLYYTDVGATLLVLCGYLLALKDRHITAAMVLFLSVCFRQTSIVWLLFVAGTVGIRALQESDIKNGTHRSGVKYFWTVLVSLLSHTPLLLLLLWPYLLTTSLFLAFVLWNGSLALGDKTHHSLSFHLPQLFYFSAFTCFFSASHLILDIKKLRAMATIAIQRFKLTLCLLLLLVVLFGVAVHNFTYEHPYLLADNRHYPFYLWKNIFRRHTAVKYMLVPAYAIATFFMYFNLSYSNGPLWLLLYFISCFVSLVPQKLIEFRYFILPYLIFWIHLPKDQSASLLFSLVVELVFNSVVNCITLWLFLYRPFHWPDTTNWQRFMW